MHSADGEARPLHSLFPTPLEPGRVVFENRASSCVNIKTLAFLTNADMKAKRKWALTKGPDVPVLFR